MPAPYGKFSYQEHNFCPILNIPSWWFSILTHVGFVVGLVLGWVTIDGSTWEIHMDGPKEGRGMLVFIILCIYIVVRIFSPLIYKATLLDDDTIGDKKVNLLWWIPYLLFWVPGGAYWRRAVATIDRPLELYDIVLCLLAALFFIMNVYSDATKNMERVEQGKKYTVIGKYLNEKQIHQKFASLQRLYHIASLPPNYMFEIAFWFVFIFISWSWEGVWWFCCIFLFLFSRGVWQKTWYKEPLITDSSETEQLFTVSGKMTF